MSELEDLLTGVLATAVREYRDVPELPDDSPTLALLSARETWLVHRSVRLALYALQAYASTPEGKGKIAAAVALREAAQYFTGQFPDDRSLWPDDEYEALRQAHDALDRAREEGL